MYFPTILVCSLVSSVKRCDVTEVWGGGEGLGLSYDLPVVAFRTRMSHSTPPPPPPHVYSPPMPPFSQPLLSMLQSGWRQTDKYYMNIYSNFNGLLINIFSHSFNLFYLFILVMRNNNVLWTFSFVNLSFCWMVFMKHIHQHTQNYKQAICDVHYLEGEWCILGFIWR